jgi:hypothetical protein
MGLEIGKSRIIPNGWDLTVIHGSCLLNSLIIYANLTNSLFLLIRGIYFFFVES